MRVLIVYPDPYLAYSPSTLNLYETLASRFEVRVLTFEPDSRFSKQRIAEKNITYLPKPQGGIRFYVAEAFSRIRQLASGTKPALLYTPKARALVREIRKFDGQIIAVDFFALWCAQHAGKKAHLLSLEIYEADNYRNNCNFSDIKSVIIQSEERYRFLFGERRIRTFFIQNAPRYLPIKIFPEKRESSKLLFCGSAMPGFGLYNCIEFIADYPEYSLTVKGSIPPVVRNVIENHFQNLLESGRLILDDRYLEEKELTKYVSGFRIGFVFYDFYRFEYINKFNYHTAPSGKLFQYYNAGVPVIGNDILGLRSVRDLNAGVLIKTMGSSAIRNAIETIERDYAKFAHAAKKASASFDTTELLKSFGRFLNEVN